MNKILRIVGYAVIVLALVLASILFVKVSKEHKVVAAMQDKIDEAEELYNSNEEKIERNNKSVQKRMEDFRCYVKSSVLPLYSDSHPGNPVGTLNTNDVLYADGKMQNGMAHIYAEIDGKQGEYYTFPSLFAREMTEQPIKVVVFSPDNGSDVTEAFRMIKALADLISSSDSCAVVYANEEMTAPDWNNVAECCGADAHIIISAAVKGENDKLCSVNADDVLQSKALAQDINRILGDYGLAEPKITEEPAADSAEEGEAEEAEPSDADPVEDAGTETETDSSITLFPEITDSTEETGDAESEVEGANDDQHFVASCTIIVRTVLKQADENPEDIGTDDASENQTDAENAEVIDNTDYTAQIINCIKVGLENYLSKL